MVKMTTLSELNRLNMYPRNEDLERQLDWSTGTSSLERATNKTNTNAKIHNMLYEALEAIDAPLDLLQIVASWGDTQPFSETIKQLQAFIEREKAR